MNSEAADHPKTDLSAADPTAAEVALQDELNAETWQPGDPEPHDNPLLAKGFAAVPNAVMNDTSLSPMARFLYALYLSFSFNKSSCWVGNERLAELMNCSLPTVIKYRKELIAAGLIRSVSRGQGKTNLTVITGGVTPKTSHPDVKPASLLDAQPALHEEEEVEEEREGAVAPAPSIQKAIAFYMDAARSASRYVAPNDAQILAKRAREAINAGATDAMLADGIGVLISKGLPVSALHGAITEAQGRKPLPKPVLTKPTVSCSVCGLGFPTERRRDEHLHNVHGYPHPDDADPES